MSFDRFLSMFCKIIYHFEINFWLNLRSDHLFINYEENTFPFRDVADGFVGS